MIFFCQTLQDTRAVHGKRTFKDGLVVERWIIAAEDDRQDERYVPKRYSYMKHFIFIILSNLL